MIRIQSHGASDVGLVRENNEDAWGCFCDNRLFIVADGLGGHQAGEVAAKEAVDTFSTTYSQLVKSTNPETLNMESVLRVCFETANKHVYELSSTHELLRGMGTTICVVALHQNKAYVGHIGDSRVYRFKKDQLEQLTHDHCWTRAFFSPENSGERPTKGVLTRALGTNPTVEPTLRIEDLEPKDLFLLCSDGLSDMVDNDEIGLVLKKKMTVGERVRSLLALAKSHGGGDNATVIVVEVLDDNA